LTHFDKETTSLWQLALDAATDSGVFELMELRTHVCGSGGLGTSCHSMPILGRVSKKVSANKRGKFGLNSADLVAHTALATTCRQVSLKKAAQLAGLLGTAAPEGHAA
jgi:hypothetical protein